MKEKDVAMNIAINEVEKLYPDNKILMVYLSGSRFYGYYREDSDYDYIVYVKPTDRELIFGKMISTDIKLDNKLVDSIKVKDIRLLVNELKKPNVNTLSLLANPVYYDLSVSGLVCDLKPTVRFSINENRKQVGMSVLGAVRANKKGDRVMLTMFLYYVSEFLIDDDNELDLSQVKTFGIMSKSEYKDRKIPDDFDELESSLFQRWKDKKVNPKQLDYESLFLGRSFL